MVDFGGFSIEFKPGDTTQPQYDEEQEKEKSKDEVRQDAINAFRKAIQTQTRGKLHELFEKAAYPLVIQMRAAGGSDHELAAQLREIADFLEDIG